MDFAKGFPFVFFIMIGLAAGRCFALDKGAIAKLLLYFVAPIVFFDATWGSNIGVGQLPLPLLIAVVASLLSLTAFRLSHRFMGSPDSNLLAFGVGSSNSGYFGLPVAAALFGDAFLPQMILVVMGFTLFEYTTGFYITARSHFSVRASLQKLVRLPALYAYSLALVLNECGVERVSWITPTSVYLRGAYTFMGLTMLGLGLADLTWKNLDFGFLMKAFLSRFIAWPIVSVLVITLLRFDADSNYFKAFSLVAFLPMAANGVLIATELKASPHKIAGAIAVSTFASLIVLGLGWHLLLVDVVRSLGG